jgi:hypothetical protein
MVPCHENLVDQRPCLFVFDVQAPQSHRRKRKKEEAGQIAIKSRQ